MKLGELIDCAVSGLEYELGYNRGNPEYNEPAQERRIKRLKELRESLHRRESNINIYELLFVIQRLARDK